MDEEVSAEHDGAALVEVETVGQHRVMAKRQKSIVQSLRDFAKAPPMSRIAGGDTLRRRNAWVQNTVIGGRAPRAPCLRDCIIVGLPGRVSRTVSASVAVETMTREMVLMSAILGTGRLRRLRCSRQGTRAKVLSTSGSPGMWRRPRRGGTGLLHGGGDIGGHPVPWQ